MQPARYAVVVALALALAGAGCVADDGDDDGRADLGFAQEPALGVRDFDPCPFDEPAPLPPEPARLAGCETAPAPLTWEQRFRTPRDDVEAEWVALLADGALAADESRFQRTRCELSRIRGFHPRTVDINAGPLAISATGIFVEWDGGAPTGDPLQQFRCLNAALDSDVTGGAASDFARTVAFGGLYHPALTVPLYEGLDAVGHANVDGLLVNGRPSEIRVVVEGDVTRYAFIHSSGFEGASALEILEFDADVDGPIDYAVRWTPADGAFPESLAVFGVDLP